MVRKILVGLIILILAVGLFFVFNSVEKTATISPTTSSGGGKIMVTASFYPLYFLAQEIGGDKVEVFNLTPAGAEPHDYEPTPQDMMRLEKSKLIILNGGGLETWGRDIEKNTDPGQALVLAVGESLMNPQLGDGKVLSDPHVWLSPPLVEKMIDKIVAGFVQIDAANSNYYLANGAALKNKIIALDEEYKTGLQNCVGKNIITAHSAFAYLAATYHFNQVPITGLSPDAEPSVQQLSAIAQFAKERKIKYIFFESLVSPKLAETLAREVGAKTLVLNPLEGLTAQESATGQNYFSIMRSNLTNLKLALQCQN